jgi:hypothetical protein
LLHLLNYKAVDVVDSATPSGMDIGNNAMVWVKQETSLAIGMPDEQGCIGQLRHHGICDDIVVEIRVAPYLASFSANLVTFREQPGFER